MSLSATLVFGIGSIIGKALLKILLDDRPLLKELAPDLLDWLKDQAKGEREQHAETQQLTQIGAAVAAKLRPIIDAARLADNELAAMLAEFMLTLSQVDAEQLVDARLVPARLARGMFAARPQATTALNAKEEKLYKQLVDAASAYVTAIASEFLGFNNLRDAVLLQDQERMCESVLTLLCRPDEESARFEAKYREVIQRELSKLELFGVRRLDQAFRKHKLNVAYVTVHVDRMSNNTKSEDEDVMFLTQLLGNATHDDTRIIKERPSSPIDDMLISQRRIVIRGDAGSGKTTLLQWIAITAAANDFTGALTLWNNSVPFFIRLRQVADQGFPSPEHYTMLVAKQVAGSQPHGWAHAQLDNGRAIVMIDGIDELPEGKREAFLEQVQDLVRDFQTRAILSHRAQQR